MRDALVNACIQDIEQQLEQSVCDSISVRLPFVPTEEELADMVEEVSKHYDFLGGIWQSAQDRSLLEIYIN